MGVIFSPWPASKVAYHINKKLSYLLFNQPHASYLITSTTTGYCKALPYLKKRTMATASETMSQATIPVVSSATIGSSRRRRNNVHYITGLNSFGGLKAHNIVTLLGLPVCTEQAFAKMVCSLKSPLQGKGRCGGAASSTCNAAAEIFRIAATMNGLVLIGVAVGFVLLRLEASLEEAE